MVPSLPFMETTVVVNPAVVLTTIGHEELRASSLASFSHSFTDTYRALTLARPCAEHTDE